MLELKRSPFSSSLAILHQYSIITVIEKAEKPIFILDSSVNLGHEYWKCPPYSKVHSLVRDHVEILCEDYAKVNIRKIPNVAVKCLMFKSALCRAFD